MSAFQVDKSRGGAKESSRASAPEPEFVLRGHGSAVNSIAFVSTSRGESADGAGGGSVSLCGGSVNGTLKLWNLSTRRAEVTIKNAHTNSSIITVAATADDQTLLTSGRDGQLQLWDMGSNIKPVCSYYTGAKHFCNAATDGYHPNMVLSPCAGESEVVLIDKRCQVPQVHLKAPPSLGMITALKIDCCGVDNHSTILGFEGGSTATIDFRKFTCVDLSPHKPSHALLSPGESEGRVAPPKVQDIHFDKGSSNMLLDSMHGRQPVMALAVARNRRVGTESLDLFTAGADRTMNKIVIDTKEAPRITEVKHPSAGTSSLALTSDAKLLASGQWDSTARIFETRTLKPLAVLRHHRDCVFSVAWAPSIGTESKRQLATASKDGTIALWSLFGDK